MTLLRRSGILLAFLLLFGQVGLRAQGFVQVIPVPRHSVVANMPNRQMAVDATPAMQSLTDGMQDILPSSTGAYYYGVSTGNTYGSVTQATKAEWLSKGLDWVSGTSNGLPGLAQRGTAAIENMVTWIDDIIRPEVTFRYEQMAGFQRMLKAFQLFRQMQIMAKSWHGSLFQFDLLDITPVFEQMDLDDFGVPGTGVRVGLRYKDKAQKTDILSNFGLTNPFIGPWDSPRLRYKGPHKFSDISFDVETSPYQGTVVTSDALRIGQAGNELLDRVWFEGVMGRNMTKGGAYYTSKIAQERPSPLLLKQRAEAARDIRIAQILEEADAMSRAYGIDPMDAINHFQEELAWWDTKPQDLYDNQMQRINRYRDELQQVHNDIVKMESPEKLKEASDPDRQNFLDGVFNLYAQIGDSVSAVVNAATGEENDNDNPGPRLIYKANVSYAKSRHAAYLEALAIRRFLFSKIQAEAQRGAADGFFNLWKDMEDRKHNVARAEANVAAYQEHANRILDRLNKMGLTPDDIHATVRGLRSK